MYEIKNEQIGSYLSKLIEQNYSSTRQFCIDCLKFTNKDNEPNETEIKNMENRLSQIKKGTKSIQIYDLPIFTEILRVSCEQILSGGKYNHVNNDYESRLTNYSVAKSKNKRIWKDYVDRPDNAICNPDEFGRTVLDYAIEYDNDEFIRFLLDNEYIWFNSTNYCDGGLDVGTIIRRPVFCDIRLPVFRGLDVSTKDAIEYGDILRLRKQLGMYIIKIAIRHKDIAIIEESKAREVPEKWWYFGPYNYHNNVIGFGEELYKEEYTKEVLKSIATSNAKVIEYFTDEFEKDLKYCQMTGNFVNTVHIFVFPYISQLLDLMVENNSKYLKKTLEKLIKHNKNVKKNIIDFEAYAKEINKQTGWEYARKDVNFYSDTNVVQTVYFTLPNDDIKNVISNIAVVSVRSSAPEINRLIDELNDVYNNIKSMCTSIRD